MKKYLPFADSPTIKSYTRWEHFDEALSVEGTPVVEGLKEGPVELPEPENWFLEEHLKRAKGFRIVSNRVKIASKGGMTFLHVEGEVNGRVLVVESSENAPLSVTGRLKGSGEILHVVKGKGPHFSRWELEGDITVRTYAEGEDIYLRYVGRGKIAAYGVSKGKWVDVHHLFEAGEIVNRHLLLGEEGSFLVHRPLARVFENGEAHLETLLVKEGGFVVGVPSVEVFSGRVRSATHAVKDLVPSEEQLFYLRSRGFNKKKAKEYLIEEVKRFLLGELYDEVF